jgi:hypothetical protein
MGMIVGLLGIASFAGCSSGATRPTGDLSDGDVTTNDSTNFFGSWTGMETVTVMCDGSAPDTASSGLTLTLVASGSDLTYTSVTGCVFDFTVSGDTATLSNVPLTCSDTTDAGVAVVTTITSYTLSTSDGQHLTGTFDSTAMADGISCPTSVTFSATRGTS